MTHGDLLEGRPAAARGGAQRRPAPVSDALPGPVDGAAPATPAWDLTITVRCGDPRPLLQIGGELDHGCAPLVAAMVDHVEAVHGRPVLVDLTGVPYADTHGLAPLLRKGVEIRRTSRQVHRLLRLLLLDPGERPLTVSSPA
ncbi:STAS domain-containing protein [Geodermatophilus sp. SYSU D00758]